MGAIRFVRAHIDTLLAVVLAAAFLIEVYASEVELPGQAFVADFELDQTLAVAAGTAFLLSLALRSRMPAVPLALAFGALALLGQGQADGIATLALGLALTAYSVGAWSGGRAALVGALGLGALAGLLVLRATSGPVDSRDVAAAILLLFGPWLVGVLARGVRERRGDPRVTAIGRPRPAGRGASDSAGHDDAVRELRDVVERSMSTVILGARNAQRSMRDDPGATDRSLTEIEVAGTEALEETQRLTSLLLAPDGASPTELGPGLADVEFLAEEVTKAGLPVDMNVSGRPLPLTPDLDAVAYRVVHEALMAALEGARDASASVYIRYEPDALEIEVSDDGLAAGDGAQQTVGLEAVRKEVAALGGTLDAGPRQGRGYSVLAQLPYEPDWS